MLLLGKPSIDRVQRFIGDQRSLDLSYLSVGATATGPPAGYKVDHTRIKLGDGESWSHGAEAVGG